MNRDTEMVREERRQADALFEALVTLLDAVTTYGDARSTPLYNAAQAAARTLKEYNAYCATQNPNPRKRKGA